jgi:hypothetical protein
MRPSLGLAHLLSLAAEGFDLAEVIASAHPPFSEWTSALPSPASAVKKLSLAPLLPPPERFPLAGMVISLV